MTIDQQLEGDFTALTDKISRERGFRCASYKEKCLRRRIAVRMRACNVHTYTEYARVLDRDAYEYDRLLDALTINVTKLFRNWETFAAIEREVAPALFARDDPKIRVWSAGCASGEEAYSLAILLHRYALAHGKRAERVSVVGTDIDRASLASAERGAFTEQAFADTPLELRQLYFAARSPHQVIDAVCRLTRFERHDLLRDPMPESQHLVACRNVVIYFDRDSQETLFTRFADALAPGGYLVLGKVETLLGAARSRFASVAGRERIFRRL